MIQDSAIITTEGKYETVLEVSSGTNLSDLE